MLLCALAYHDCSSLTVLKVTSTRICGNGDYSDCYSSAASTHMKVWKGPSAVPLVISMFFVCSLFLEGTHYFFMSLEVTLVLSCLFTAVKMSSFSPNVFILLVEWVFLILNMEQVQENTQTHTHTLIAACKLPPQRLSSWLERAMETSGKEAETAELGSGKHTHTHIGGQNAAGQNCRSKSVLWRTNATQLGLWRLQRVMKAALIRGNADIRHR